MVRGQGRPPLLLATGLVRSPGNGRPPLTEGGKGEVMRWDGGLGCRLLVGWAGGPI